MSASGSQTVTPIPSTVDAGSRSNVLGRAIESARVWPLTLLAGYAGVRALIYSRAKPFWYDEILTTVVSSLGNPHAIRNALAQGLDGQPPLFYLLEGVCARLIPDPHVGYRLLSVLAFVCTLACVYFFVKTRNGTGPALISASMLLTGSLLAPYAAEARPYSLLTACIAFGLVCYQRSAEARWVVALFISLCLACAIHYYAVFALVPFLLAELAFFCFTKKIRFAVWTSLIAAPLPILLSWSLLLHMKEQWGGHFWASAFPESWERTYGDFFSLPPMWGIALALTAAIALHARFRTETSPLDARAVSERVLILALIFLPILGFAEGKMMDTGYVGRYFLPGALGVVAASGYLFARLKPATLSLVALCVLSAIAVHEWDFWQSHPMPVKPEDQVRSVVRFAQIAHRDDLPIVFSDELTYLPFWFYAPPSLRQRTTTLADPASAVAYVGTDTTDRVVLLLPSFAPISVRQRHWLTSEHPSFLLYTDQVFPAWLPAVLAHQGYHFQTVASNMTQSMYLLEPTPDTVGQGR